jgi:hypothetical protein
MKIVSYIVIVLATILMIYNATKVDFSSPFEGDSTIAFIGIVASLCAIVLMLIFLMSKMIDDKTKN